MLKKRIFIAIQIPEEVKNIAENYIKPFTGDKNIRIPKRKGWHITLVFCGYLEEKELGKVREIVGNIVSKTKSFKISPDKILFYPLKRPHMVWLAFAASPQFSHLKKEVEDGIISFQIGGLFKNFRVDYPPNPHMNLARFEENYFHNIKNFLPENGVDLTKETMPFLVKSIDIMESHLSRTGADYETLTKIGIGTIISPEK